MNKLITSFIFLLFFYSKSFSQVYTIETVPNPTVSGVGYISDPDHVLSQATIDGLNAKFIQLKSATTDEVALVVLNSIGDAVLKEFSTALFNKWGIGLKGKDNGLLILLVMDQHRVEFETGYGMEAVLPDAICKRIQMTYMIPRFKESNYDQGLIDGIDAALDILQNKENSKYFLEMNTPEYSDESNDTVNILSGISFLVFLIIPGIVFLVKRNDKSFEDLYESATTTEKSKITLIMSKGKWALLYVGIPMVVLAYMYFFYGGDQFVFDFCLIFYLYFVFIFIEKRLRSNEYYAKNAIHQDYYGNYLKYTEAHEYWWWTAVFFPIPFLIYVFYYFKQKDKLRNHPRNCKNCSDPMLKLDEVADDKHLSKAQLLEEELKSVDYDVWYCGGCSAKQVYSFKNIFSKYSNCASCGTRAYYLYSNVTLVSATYDSTGTGEKTYKCKYCGKTHSETYTIARKERSSSSSSSGGGGGSSFGGGSSGGGGSGSSW